MTKIMELIGKYIILEKLSGERYRPDMIVGDKSVQGYCLENPQKGYQFYLYTSPTDITIGEAVIPKGELPCAWTSVVQEIDLENGLIKTKNSTYKIEIK
jgi:hypothetical protein